MHLDLVFSIVKVMILAILCAFVKKRASTTFCPYIVHRRGNVRSSINEVHGPPLLVDLVAIYHRLGLVLLMLQLIERLVHLSDVNLV